MSSSDREETGEGDLIKKWATVVLADVVGYTRLMSNDPAKTVADLDDVRAIVRKQAENHGGYIADEVGDAILAVFDTSIGAVYASCAAQVEISERALGSPENRKMMLRMGIHNGEILEKPDATIYGDGVNIAARLESLAPTGGVAVSEDVRRACGDATSLRFLDQGEYEVKNVENPVHVHLIAQRGGAKVLDLPQRMKRTVILGNLPERATELIGREDALAEVKTHLETSRLVTLFGMGGLGKTSLSIEAGRHSASNYPDGVWFADLAAISDPAAVALAIAGLFGVSQQSEKSMLESLVDALRGRRMLIILDNCEHLIGATATVADAILTTCPKISLIATSRELLSISGEQVMQVAPLQISGSNAPAIELFTERAKAVSHTFQIENNEADVRDICEKLDGVPLAIELAAARVKSMTPRQIRDRLDQRFRLLTGGSRAETRTRHQTLQNAVQWSYDLLNDTEEAVLNRASVFAGGFTLEAAEAVCAGGEVDAFDVVDILDSLVSKSLVTVTQTDNNFRYGILETIRAFGGDKLAASADAADVRHAHATFYADQSDANFKLWRSANQMKAHEWLDLEINNLRDAFRWANENNDIDPAARIASSVGDLARFRLREEAANWAEEVVDQARTARHPRLIILLTWCASSAWAFGRFEEAKRFGEEALSLLDDETFEPFVWAYGDLAFVAIFSGKLDEAIELLATGANHPADAHDRMMMAFHLYILATAGHADKALTIADDVVAKVNAAGVPMSIAVAHGARGAALEAENPKAALAEYEHAIDVASTSGVRFMETLIAPRLAAVHGRSGEPEAALQGFERMLLAYGDATDMASISAWRTNLVILFAKTGQFHAAATLHGTLVGQIDQSSLAVEYSEAIENVREALGMKTFSTTSNNGSAMSLREATNYAIAQVQLGLEGQKLKATG